MSGWIFLLLGGFFQGLGLTSVMGFFPALMVSAGTVLIACGVMDDRDR